MILTSLEVDSNAFEARTGWALKLESALIRRSQEREP